MGYTHTYIKGKCHRYNSWFFVRGVRIDIYMINIQRMSKSLFQVVSIKPTEEGLDNHVPSLVHQVASISSYATKSTQCPLIKNGLITSKD